jgi:UDP-2,3-diacylglucosamine pyrophosphatase LpxH
MNNAHNDFKALAAFLTSPQLSPLPPPNHDELRHEPLKCRTLFLSDLHMNYTMPENHCRVICDVLDHVAAKNLIIVGDIADLRKNGSQPAQNKKLYDPQHYTAAMRQVLRRAARNFNPERSITVLGGNHDAGLRDLGHVRYGNFHVAPAIIHYTVTGHGYFVAHGDQFDTGQKMAREERTKIYKQNICVGMTMLDTLCAQRGRTLLHGVILGHAHQPAHETLTTDIGHDFIYHNLGAWPKPIDRTFMIETHAGKLQHMEWDEASGIKPHMPLSQSTGLQSARACGIVRP